MSKRKINWFLWGLDQIWWQVRAAVFGASFVFAIGMSAIFWDPGWGLARSDALFGFGVVGLVVMFALGWNVVRDAVPMAFMAVLGIGLELQRTGIGAWSYEAGGVLTIGAKPLFVGFMYAAVASYVIRSLRLKALEIQGMPPAVIGFALGLAIYSSYFLGFPAWVRPALLLLAVLVFVRSRVQSASGSWLPVPLALFMAAFLIWVAENVGTFSGTWSYRGQAVGELVGLSKISAWFLLLNICFLLVAYLGPDDLWHRREGKNETHS